MFYTYIHRRNDTGAIFYVGKGSTNRAYSSSSRSRHWLAIVAKHGLTVEICAPWRLEQEAFEHEIFLIETLRAMGVELINRTVGGDGISGHRHSTEVRARMSQSHKDRYKKEGERELRSKASKAVWADPVMGAMMRDKFRIELKRPEVHARRVASMREASKRPEVMERRSAAQRAAQGLPESREKQRLARLRSETPGGRGAKPVLCLSTGDWFESAAGAARYFGIGPTHVASACRGQRSHVSGLMFEWASAHPLSQAPA